jgi:hypothetical protein
LQLCYSSLQLLLQLLCSQRLGCCLNKLLLLLLVLSCLLLLGRQLQLLLMHWCLSPLLLLLLFWQRWLLLVLSFLCLASRWWALTCKANTAVLLWLLQLLMACGRIVASRN